jgi:hypothetical protein
MVAAVLKMHHPYFFDFFCLNHIGGGFQLYSVLFSLWQSGGIAFGLHGDFFVFLRRGIHHNNRPVPSSNTDKQRKQCHSNDTEFGVNTKRDASGLAKRPEDIVKGDQSFGLPDICEALIESPKWSLRAFTSLSFR